MYQFYYADVSKQYLRGVCNDNIANYINVTAIRPTMWEEHCLECAAPLCYKNCLHYIARSDGRCKRFDNSFLTFNDSKACCGQGAHLRFRKWANMMTIIFPGMLSNEKYQTMFEKNQKLGEILKKVTNSRLPEKVRWELIRTAEFLRRRKLRHMQSSDSAPNAFVFHGFSYESRSYNLIVEVYSEQIPVYKIALPITPGENIYVLSQEQLSSECWKEENLIKIYPEGDLEAELDIYWCDFVQGESIGANIPASKVKCVVWDLDKTLWDSILIETENPNQIKLNEGVLDIIRAFDERGIIQSIASKNDFDLAWPVIEHMGISDYFLYPQIHWNAKSDSIETIAKKLNIGIDSLALIDDSIFEREQVRNVWPQVRTYDVVDLPEMLLRPEFSSIVTEESKKRRFMYQAEEKRNDFKKNGNDDVVTFLRKCHLKIKIFVPTLETEILRCYELVVRTNQLNMSGKKYTQEEFDEVLKHPKHKNFAFSCSDDFGEYGIVGFGQYYVKGKQLIFTEFSMSCRVAGKYVESALFTELLKNEQCLEGIFKVQKTKKNDLLRRTLAEIGFVETVNDEKHVSYAFKSSLKHSDLVLCQK